MKILDSIDEERPLLHTSKEMGVSLLKGYQTKTTTPSPPAAIDTANAVEEASTFPSDATSMHVVKPAFTRGHFLLFLVAILYGTLNVCLRKVYDLVDPPSASALSTVRGWLAAVCFIPFLCQARSPSSATITAHSSEHNHPNHNGTLKQYPPLAKGFYWVAIELAVWNFGAQGLANMGLLYIASARAAFLTQLSVVMTPLLSASMGMQPHSNVWWACALALGGLVLLSSSGASGTDGQENDSSHVSWDFSLGLGDLLCLGGALSWSAYLFRLSAVGSVYPEVQLQAAKTFFLAILYTLWCVGATLVTGQTQWLGWTNGLAWVLLFYSAAGPGTLADLLQQQGQATVSATVANIVLSLEPVFTAVFGRVLLGELTSNVEKMGGACIILAALLATFE